MREATDALDLPFLDLTQELILAERSQERMYWALDGHCNAKGYGVIAESCARHWLEGELPAANPFAQGTTP